MVQVENSPDSRPHSGLQKADIVYEYLTEGGITRFTAIYLQPGGPQQIGPVRSARLVTLRLQKAYAGVLFYSGASDFVLGKLQAAHVPALSEDSDNGRYFARDRGRVAPHNLFTTGDKLGEGVRRTGLRVTYDLPRHGEPPHGDVANKVTFDQTPSHSVSYTYSAAERVYQYANETGAEVDTANNNQPLKVTNVVLVRVGHHSAGYTEDVLGEQGIDFDLQGEGAADVYTRGTHLAARWDLSHPDRPLRLVGADKKELVLPEGLTWIHLVDPETKVAAA
jgi:hypothetical protein